MNIEDKVCSDTSQTWDLSEFTETLPIVFWISDTLILKEDYCHVWKKESETATQTQED